MTTYLPLDERNNVIPALRMKGDKAHTISTSASSTRNSTAFSEDTHVISIYATEDIYLRFGGDSVTATTSDHFFPAGLYYDVSLGEEANGHATHLAVLRVATDGTVYISEKG